MTIEVAAKQFRQYLDTDAPRWLRVAFGIGLLLFNILVITVASQRQLMMINYLLISVGLIFIFMRWPTAGLLIAALSGMIIDWEGPSGLSITMILVAVLLVFWLIDLFVHNGSTWHASSSTFWPLLLFLLASVFSFGIGQLPWYPFARHAPLGAQLAGLSIVILSAGTFLFTANQLREMVVLKRLTWAFLAFSGLYVFLNIVLPLMGTSTWEMLQPVGSMFYIWLVAIAFSQALYNRDLHPLWRILLLGIVAANIYFHMIIRYDLKSSWIPIMVALAAVVGFRSWLSGLVTLILGIVSINYMSSGVFISEAYSLSTRLDAWLILYEIVKISPIWGLGFANYYQYTPLFPIRGYTVSFNSHNNYLDIIAQVGLVGFTFFILFILQLTRLGFRLKREAPPGFPRAYVYGALGGLAGMLVAGMLGDWVLPFFYNIGLIGFRSSMLGWLFLGGLVGLEQILKKTETEI